MKSHTLKLMKVKIISEIFYMTMDYQFLGNELSLE
jgi:hypothetical protein